jgi:3-deoxy-D-manno-octulosonic-acid transferase
VQPLFDLLHPCIDKVLCQTESDAERFERLGIEKNKLFVTGSIKFDIQISNDVREKAKSLRNALGLERPIWIAASTHKGEDEQVLEAHKKILEWHPNALLILVPRHPERFEDVFELCQGQGFETARRTSQEEVTTSTQVYLGDTMGEMLTLIGSADICVMGGSLIGNKVGGHNVLEPAALGVPVITGPSYYNFKEMVNSLIAQDGSIITVNLSETVLSLLQSAQLKEKLVVNGKAFVEQNKGSIRRVVLEILTERLEC